MVSKSKTTLKSSDMERRAGDILKRAKTQYISMSSFKKKDPSSSASSKKASNSLTSGGFGGVSGKMNTTGNSTNVNSLISPITPKTAKIVFKKQPGILSPEFPSAASLKTLLKENSATTITTSSVTPEVKPTNLTRQSHRPTLTATSSSLSSSPASNVSDSTTPVAPQVVKIVKIGVDQVIQSIRKHASPPRQKVIPPSPVNVVDGTKENTNGSSVCGVDFEIIPEKKAKYV